MQPCCPICCDDEKSSKRLKLLKCCGQQVCHDCVYEHIKNVLQEGLTGDGRKTLVCPMGCGKDLTDKVIRSSIRRKHFSFRHHIIGMKILNMLKNIGIFFVLRMVWPKKELYFHWYNSMVRSRDEGEDLLLYERWNLSVGLLNRVDWSMREEDVIRCPAPNCSYSWLGATQYRNNKRQNEPNTGNNNGNFRDMLGISSFFYKPLPHERHPSAWVHCSHSEAKDGRKLTCPSCLSEFCGLCRRPWTLTTRKNKRLCHKGKSCSNFSGRTSSIQDNDYILTEAKVCPGCTMLVHRTSGCNHMTCVCGMQWCYICECRWHAGHYSCTHDARIVDVVEGLCAIS